MSKSPLLSGEMKGHIGVDESGKGDYFGPLIVAGIFVPDNQKKVLQEIGVKDSKRISDNRIKEMSDILRKGYQNTVVVIGPEKYNELYEKMRNLNRILAWAHSRAIENILEEVPCSSAITDQFGDKSFVLNALMKRGKNIELIQKTKGEEDIVVAAASIIARAEFLKRLYFLSQDWGMEIPRGASPAVEERGIKLAKKHGIQVFRRLAKVHFKTTERIKKNL